MTSRRENTFVRFEIFNPRSRRIGGFIEQWDDILYLIAMWVVRYKTARVAPISRDERRAYCGRARRRDASSGEGDPVFPLAVGLRVTSR